MLRETTFSSDTSCSVEARAFVGEQLEAAGVDRSQAFELLLALNEAVANACRHGYGGASDGEIRVSAGVMDSNFMMVVSDSGPGFTVTEEMFEMPDPMSSRGRGFFLMRELTDSVEVHSTEAGTTVMLVWSLAGRRSAAYQKRSPSRSR